MALRTFLTNIGTVLFGCIAIAVGLFVLVTGADLRHATSDEAFVVRSIPYVFIMAGLIAASQPFWLRRMR